MSALKTQYFEKIRPELKNKFSLKSIMQVPRLEKIVLNMCVFSSGEES